jgi:hypothetical protein
MLLGRLPQVQQDVRRGQKAVHRGRHRLRRQDRFQGGGNAGRSFHGKNPFKCQSLNISYNNSTCYSSVRILLNTIARGRSECALYRKLRADASPK